MGLPGFDGEALIIEMPEKIGVSSGLVDEEKIGAIEGTLELHYFFLMDGLVVLEFVSVRDKHAKDNKDDFSQKRYKENKRV